jgi:outer membrane protein TolC
MKACAKAMVLMLALTRGDVWAQQVPLTLNQAVQQALSNYPAVRSSLEQVLAAAAGIRLARTSYLPRVDFLGQANRATHNNVFGMLFSQPIISPISGPVLGTNSLNSVWGSAVGVLVSWEPFDFGLRRANIEAAQSSRERTSAQANITRLQVGAAAADTFLTILAAQQTVTAAKAAVERARILNEAVEALVKNELRPGADASRTRAEWAVAETQLIRSEEAVDVSRAALSQLLGVPSQTISIQPGPLLQLPEEREISGLSATNHPIAVAENRVIEEVKSRENVLGRSYFPRFNLQGTAYARGTGAHPDGTTELGANGLGPNIENWGVAVTVTFPSFDFASIRARKEIELHLERAATARYDQVLQDLNGQMEKARVRLAAARRVARNTPVQLEAARATEQQAKARYRAGLGNIVEVAEAQRILRQAEIDDALAKLDIWRALLGIATAAGDLQPFLQQVLR